MSVLLFPILSRINGTEVRFLPQRRQSNAHVIRWSDGSMSLRLGKEYFDINQVIDSSGSAHRQAFGSQNSQSQSQGAPVLPPGKAHGLTYLVAQHKRAEILQAEAAITGFLTLRPTDMQSETHRLVVRAVGQKHSKVARLRMAPDRDPEREKQELIRSAAVKKPRHPRGEDGGGGGGGARRRRTQSGGRRRSGGDMDIWSDDEEPEYDPYGNDEDGGRSPKKRRAREPEERRGGEYQPDDFVVADSDEDDTGARASDDVGRRKKGAHEEVEEDVLDKLDAQINQQEADRKRRREEEEGHEAPVEADLVGEAAMDIESEDAEEEEFRVRRVGGTRTRKAVAGFDEEDE
jgi:RNA polymerase-associated protein LEO1